MESNLPISIVPRLFTQYRDKVLTQTKQCWFHVGYRTTTQSDTPTPSSLTLSPTELVQDLASQESQEETSDVPNAAIASQECLTPFSSEILSDPWDEDFQPLLDPNLSQSESDRSVSILAQPARSSIEFKGTEVSEVPVSVAFNPEIDPAEQIEGATLFHGNLRTTASIQTQTATSQEGVEPASVTNFQGDFDITSEEIVAEKISTTLTQEDRELLGSRVNLFPFESPQPSSFSQAIESLEHDSIYDLTEFNNGELEDPPLAIRESKPSSFEKLPIEEPTAESADLPKNAEESDTKTLDPLPAAKKRKKEPPASAEIAKFRLRNCL